MPRTINKEKAELLASIYCTTGHYNKSESMVLAGYKDSYARSGLGLKTYDNIRVKEAIARIEAKSRAKTDYTIDQCQQEYDEARKLALALKQPSAAVSAITGKARLYGYDKDNDLAKTEQPPPLSDAELELLRRQAIALTG